MDQPFPLQRTDYLALCFCKFVNLRFFGFIVTYMKLILLYYLRTAGYLQMERYHTLQFVLLFALLKKLITETKIHFHGFVAVYVEALR